MNTLARAITQEGFAVWNIEYRRVGRGGGWPNTLRDVASAIDFLATLEGVDPDRIITCGHSAGGHLALWAAGRDRTSPLRAGNVAAEHRVVLRAAIALAGVSDLKMGAELNLGNGAVAELLGGSIEDFPERYREASPLELLPLGLPQILLHGLADEVVPARMSESYVEQAVRSGDLATYVPLAGLGHRELISAPGIAWDALSEHLRATLS
jgi:acetyl esterase/lipase